MTKYIDKLREHFNNYDYPVFTLADIRVFLGGTEISQRYLKILINHMIKKREIIRISKGSYTFHKEMAVVGFAYAPFYYGLEDALSYRNMWTQMANPAVMTTRNARDGLRKFSNGNYVVKHISAALFFGFDYIKYYDLWLPVSDPEKTMIDLVYYHHDIRKDALKKLLESLNRARLDEYLKHYGKAFRRRVLWIVSSEYKRAADMMQHSSIANGRDPV